MKRTVLLKDNQFYIPLYLYFKELYEVLNMCDNDTYIMFSYILTYNFYYSKNIKYRVDRVIIDRYTQYV